MSEAPRLPHRDTRGQEHRISRAAAAAAHFALAAMLLYGVARYFSTIVPRFGARFSYVAVVMVGLAIWMAFRGAFVLTGRGREGG
jgi:hypothetical protein